MMVTLGRIIQAGLRNFLRNAWLSTAATAVMTITLIVITVSFVSTRALTSTIKGVVDKIDISVYLKDSVTPDQLTNLRQRLSSLDNVASVVYVSKADALVQYQQQNKDNKELLDAVTATDNPLPQSLAIKAKDHNKLDPILSVVTAPDVKSLLQDKDPISYSGKRKKTIDNIIGGSNFLKRGGLVASVIFVIISVLIIFNTIRMAIFTRRDEIEIMKLVGATKGFIRGPFIFEAMLYGIIAAVITSVLTYLLLVAGALRSTSYIDFSSTVAVLQHSPGLFLLGELAIGMGIGILSSMLALSRYLKL